jgi:hypothetical protein
VPALERRNTMAEGDADMNHHRTASGLVLLLRMSACGA